MSRLSKHSLHDIRVRAQVLVELCDHAMAYIDDDAGGLRAIVEDHITHRSFKFPDYVANETQVELFEIFTKVEHKPNIKIP